MASCLELSSEDKRGSEDKRCFWRCEGEGPGPGAGRKRVGHVLCSGLQWGVPGCCCADGGPGEGRLDGAGGAGRVAIVMSLSRREGQGLVQGRRG